METTDSLIFKLHQTRQDQRNAIQRLSTLQKSPVVVDQNLVDVSASLIDAVITYKADIITTAGKITSLNEEAKNLEQGISDYFSEAQLKPGINVICNNGGQSFKCWITNQGTVEVQEQ